MKKTTFFGAIGKMWAKTFDYKGKATQKEYWFPFIFHALIMLIAAGLLVASFMTEEFGLLLCLAAFALLGYLTLSILPWISLTIRRLRDAGKSGWWTLLLLIVGIGVIALLIICSAGSAVYNVTGGSGGFDPFYNEEPAVYGPPEIFDPSNNSPEEVYGPPLWEDEPVDPEEESDEYLNDEPIVDPGEPSKFDPNKNEEPVVYGPPEMFEPANNTEVEVYGPPEMFEDLNDKNDN